MLAQDIIRAKRDGGALDVAQIAAFVQGLVDGSWCEGQAAALAMAVCCNGMNHAETIALTRAMTESGTRLDWSREAFDGPLLDKHSTGGVGDKTSLLVAPIVAACGGVVPMVSGRGLGHTGGTLDKLESLPGYQVTPSHDRLLATLHRAGCAIVGASADLAPADRRLYAIRDDTATVEAIPLITASILSKKLAAGVQALVLDVKVGNGAFCATPASARELASSLVDVARGAGLPCTALLTDMNQVLGTSAGNALEVREALAALRGDVRDARLIDVSLELSARLLQSGGVHADLDASRARARAALDGGAAAERFARMVAALGGPRDARTDPGLPSAPCVRELPSPRDGVLAATDTRAVGSAIVELGGGRRVPDGAIDPRVGLDAIVPLGTRVRAGQPLARIHAASDADAARAAAALAAAFEVRDEPRATAPLLLDVIVAAR
jgi:thymidine phosphorylase